MRWAAWEASTPEERWNESDLCHDLQHASAHKHSSTSKYCNSNSTLPCLYCAILQMRQTIIPGLGLRRCLCWTWIRLYHTQFEQGSILSLAPPTQNMMCTLIYHNYLNTVQMVLNTIVYHAQKPYWLPSSTINFQNCSFPIVNLHDFPHSKLSHTVPKNLPKSNTHTSLRCVIQEDAIPFPLTTFFLIPNPAHSARCACCAIQLPEHLDLNCALEESHYQPAALGRIPLPPIFRS